MRRFLASIVVAALSLLALSFVGCSKPKSVDEQLDFRLCKGGESYYVAGAGKAAGSEIVIPAEYNGKPVVGVGGKSFKDNKNITAVAIPSSVEWVEIAAFKNCTALKRVEWNAVKARTSEGEEEYQNRVFSGCENVEEFIIGDGVESIPGGLFAYSGGSKISEIALPKSLKKVAASTFSSVNRIDIKVSDLGKWLAIEKPVFGAPLASSYALYFGDSEVESLDLGEASELDPYEFAGCVSIKSVALGSKIEKIARSAFSGCRSLSEITVGEDNPNYYLSSGVVYSRVDNIVTLVPPAMTGEAVIPDGVPSVPANVFSGTAIKKLIIPGTVRVVGGDSFSDCAELETVVIGDGTTEISDFAFGGCPSLKTVIVSKTVRRMGAELFKDSTDVAVYYLGETCPTGEGWERLSPWIYSELAPSGSGSFWHWAEDGETPVKWDVVSNDDRVNVPRPMPRRSQTLTAAVNS